jgi:hypothetical protein
MAQKNKSTENASGSGSTELANLETSENLPAFMRGSAQDGKSNIDQGDMIIPRVALMQSTHDEVEEGKVRAGSFWHTILEEDVGTSIDDLVVVHHSKRYNLWKPRHEGGGILARASDGRRWDESFRGMEFEVQPDKMRPRHKVKWVIDNDGIVNRDVGLGAWGTSDPENPDSQPAATLSHVLVCVRLSRLDMGPFVVLLQRTAEKVAKGLLTKVNIDQAPIYGQVYRMSSKQESSPSGDFYQYTFAKNGYVPDQAIFEQLQDMFKKLDAQGVKYDDAQAGGEGDIASTGGGAPAEDDGRY